jgi:hypothetical protein
MELTDSVKEINFQNWISSITEEQVLNLKIANSKAINVNSEIQKKNLYETFRFCRRTIAFWLNI